MRAEEGRWERVPSPPTGRRGGKLQRYRRMASTAMRRDSLRSTEGHLRLAWDRPVGQRLHYLAVGCGDLAGLLIEETRDLEPLRHFGEGNDGLDAHGEIDAGVGLFATADAIEPVLFVDANILGLQALDGVD